MCINLDKATPYIMLHSGYPISQDEWFQNSTNDGIMEEAWALVGRMERHKSFHSQKKTRGNHHSCTLEMTHRQYKSPINLFLSPNIYRLKEIGFFFFFFRLTTKLPAGGSIQRDVGTALGPQNVLGSSVNREVSFVPSVGKIVLLWGCERNNL